MNGLCVQYGCGHSAPKEWLNFDASPVVLLQQIPLVGRVVGHFPPNVRYGNIVKGLPIKDGTVTALYASHVLEHLTQSDCAVALQNSFKVLEPGGVFRLIVPDLRARAGRYLSGELSSVAFMEACCLGEKRARTALHRIRSMIGNSQHLWMYDYDAMTAMLAEAGFSKIRRCSFGDSTNRMFGLVERQDRFTEAGHDEVAIEAERPK